MHARLRLQGYLCSRLPATIWHGIRRNRQLADVATMMQAAQAYLRSGLCVLPAGETRNARLWRGRRFRHACPHRRNYRHGWRTGTAGKRPVSGRCGNNAGPSNSTGSDKELTGENDSLLDFHGLP